MKEQNQAELLPPIAEREDEQFPLLRIQEPMERLSGLLDRIVETQGSLMVWAQKMEVDSPASRDDARAARKSLHSVVKKVEETRLLIFKPVDEYRAEFKALCDEKIAKVQAAIEQIDAKGVAYAQECKRREDEEKAAAIAKKKAEDDRIAAERREREAKEEAARAEEIRRVQAQQAKDKAAAKLVTDKQQKALLEIQQEENRKAELARIEQERVKREKEEADLQIEEERKKNEAAAQMVGSMAKATGHGKTKGVKTIWVIEIVDEKKVPRQFCKYDPSKAKKYMDAGLAGDTSDPKAIIEGLMIYPALTSTGS